jgi:hypothetical protein
MQVCKKETKHDRKRESAQRMPANANHIDIAPVLFLLRVHVRIAIHLGRRRDQKARAASLGEAEHVHRAEDASLDRVDRILLIKHRARRAGQVVHLIRFEEERLSDVVANEFEARIVEQVRDVGLLTREEVVDANHLRFKG